MQIRPNPILVAKNKTTNFANRDSFFFPSDKKRTYISLFPLGTLKTYVDSILKNLGDHLFISRTFKLSFSAWDTATYIKHLILKS